jgi:hypothetical protein
MEGEPQSPDAWSVVKGKAKSPKGSPNPNKKFKAKHPKKMPVEEMRRCRVGDIMYHITNVRHTLQAASRSPLPSEFGRAQAVLANANLDFVTVENALGPDTEYTFETIEKCVENSYGPLGPLCAKMRRAAAERWEKLVYDRTLRDTCIRELPVDVQVDFAKSVRYVREGLKPIPPPPPRPRACRS